jgi:hypothetical protein
MRSSVDRVNVLLAQQGRRLSQLCSGTFFERLLTRFSVPEARVASSAAADALLANALHFAHLQELFGPLSLRALEADQYVRQTAGYLPQANVAFIDEARARAADGWLALSLTLRAHALTPTRFVRCSRPTARC